MWTAHCLKNVHVDNVDLVFDMFKGYKKGQGPNLKNVD